MSKRQKFEAQFSTQTAVPTSKEKLIAAMQQSYEKETPIDVSKNSILSLRRWAMQRAQEDQSIPYAPDRITSSCHWDGYLRAIDHILEMEDQ